MRDRSVSTLSLVVALLVLLWGLAALAQGATNPPPDLVAPDRVPLAEFRAAGGAASFTSQRELVLTLLAGLPVLLDTSFNRAGEPIVESPADALRLLAETGLDAVALEDRWVART